MPRYQPYSNPRLDDRELLNEFFLAVASLTSVREVANFLKDLLSVTETTMLARRLRVAARLAEGKGYDEITEELGVGRATIAGVQRWLDHGHNGYRVALQHLGKTTGRQMSTTRAARAREPFSPTRLQHKYPGR